MGGKGGGWFPAKLIKNEELRSAWSGENGINLFKLLFSIQPSTIERNFVYIKLLISLLNQTKVRFGINSDTITCAHKLHCVSVLDI